jgi:hypothetical protein
MIKENFVLGNEHISSDQMEAFINGIPVVDLSPTDWNPPRHFAHFQELSLCKAGSKESTKQG